MATSLLRYSACTVTFRRSLEGRTVLAASVVVIK